MGSDKRCWNRQIISERYVLMRFGCLTCVGTEQDYGIMVLYESGIPLCKWKQVVRLMRVDHFWTAGVPPFLIATQLNELNELNDRAINKYQSLNHFEFEHFKSSYRRFFRFLSLFREFLLECIFLLLWILGVCVDFSRILITN